MKHSLFTTEYFIKRAREIHGDKYDYSMAEYSGSQSPIKITCRKHGEFTQKPSAHLSGYNCNLCRYEDRTIKHSEFVDRLKIISPSLTVLTESNGVRSYVKISDELGVIYNMNVGSLLKGTMPTIRIAVDKNLAFEIKSRAVHGSKYDYSNSRYITTETKLDIYCNEHGIFTQRPMSHLLGAGCPKCGEVLTRTYNIKNPHGWNISDWSNAANLSKNFTGFKVYIINCHNDNEEFIKIGRTYVDISRRFMNKEKMPYDYEVIKIITGNVHHVFKLESKLKRICSKMKHSVKIEFGGMHECFDVKCLELIKNYL